MSNSLSNRTLYSIVRFILDGTHSPKLTNEIVAEVRGEMTPEEYEAFTEQLVTAGIRDLVTVEANTATIRIGGEVVQKYISLILSGTTQKQRFRFDTATIYQVKLWMKQRSLLKGVKDANHDAVTESVTKLLAALPRRARSGDRLADYFSETSITEAA